MTYRAYSLSQLAHRLGMSFAPTDEYGLAEQLREFRLFSTGRRRDIRHVLRQQHSMHEFDIRIFDYVYQPLMAKASEAVYQTVFFVQSGQLSLPDMQLQPETLVHKLGDLLGLGGGDIDFVRYPKFSDQYHLSGGDEEYIRHHFTDEVLHYFTLNKGWHVEGLGYYLIIYKKGTLLPPEQIEGFYRRGLEVFGLLTDEDARNRIFGQ